MAVVYFGARAVDQRSPPLNALAVVAAVLVAADPLSVADPGFILTFGATLAILIVAPAVAAVITKTRSLRMPACFRERPFVRSSARLLVSMLAASVAAEALLFPVGAVIFSRVTFAGLALNLLAIPMMGVTQIAGMAVVPLSALSSRMRPRRGMDCARRRFRAREVGWPGRVRAVPHLSAGAAIVGGRRRLLRRGGARVGALDAAGGPSAAAPKRA